MVPHLAHNQEIVGSSPTPATKKRSLLQDKASFLCGGWKEPVFVRKLVRLERNKMKRQYEREARLIQPIRILGIELHFNWFSW